ncbi:hypothetical protein RCM87_14910 [Escherichia marmotae]|uniref:Uncharacterized protein n=1 Tax=Escherichia marmotae TaxID=1499973 RepID=A0A7H9KDQ2_9ESCH|nr:MULTISPECIES: hypothetical protein [Escherichia]MBA7740670.1 hypothetical protein [Escherichia marmotae]MBA7897884.1 hypothetical protein [Escherichia marmotae]MBA7954803.1 hypothetical protein [Escherichia marmotae]MBB2300717.1 hypothetical protein [Escherichia sp. 93.1447]MBB2335878.1 hypothetical protein [Escherichia sp. 93.0724]
MIIKTLKMSTRKRD